MLKKKLLGILNEVDNLFDGTIGKLYTKIVDIDQKPDPNPVKYAY